MGRNMTVQLKLQPHNLLPESLIWMCVYVRTHTHTHTQRRICLLRFMKRPGQRNVMKLKQIQAVKVCKWLTHELPAALAPCLSTQRWDKWPIPAFPLITANNTRDTEAAAVFTEVISQRCRSDSCRLPQTLPGVKGRVQSDAWSGKVVY